MAYHPIDRHGLIGNTRSAALVAPEGSIGWLCLPRFDSPSLFGALLDDRIGGAFSIGPVGAEGVGEGLLRTQYYWPDTNVFVTRYSAADRVAEVVDFMPAAEGAAGPERGADLVRLVRVEHGRVRFRAVCGPAFDYARADHAVEIVRGGAVFRAGAGALALGSTVPLRVSDGATSRAGRPAAEASFELSGGESACFTLRYSEASGGDGPTPIVLDHASSRAAVEREIKHWRGWLSRCTYKGRWRERVTRSALALKLLTHSPTGAIVAAPTTSLPEGIGGTRNWDYRYTWLRDAAFTVYAFLRIGLTREAGAFMGWLHERMLEREPGEPLAPMFRVDGTSDLTEEELPHLAGYMGSRPVRIGNGAHGQLQLDVTGAVLDAAYLHNKHAEPVSHDLWVALRGLVDWTSEHRDDPDEGIWEVRGGQRHFVYSKLMCWVALDRGLRLADKRSFPCDRVRWRAARDALYEEIWTRGWDEARGAFVQAYGGDHLDAANLIMPLVLFASPNDPRVLRMIDAIDRPLGEGGLAADLLVYRYHPTESDDGVGGPVPEGGFNMCTLWLIEAMTRAGRTDARRLERARTLFDRILHSSGPHALYSEQTALDGAALGNYPQAFTHLAFISAAYNLDRALDGRGA